MLELSEPLLFGSLYTFHAGLPQINETHSESSPLCWDEKDDIAIILRIWSDVSNINVIQSFSPLTSAGVEGQRHRENTKV